MRRKDNDSQSSVVSCIALLKVMNRSTTTIITSTKNGKRKLLSENEKPMPKPKPGFHSQKSLLHVWWNMKGIFRYGLLARGRSTTVKVY